MDSVFYSLMIQTLCYAGVMVFMFVACAVLLRGFFLKYLKVRTSFGKYVLVKIRTVLRDYYAVGWIDEGYLVYKTKDAVIRIALNTTEKFIYKSLAVNWVDVDEEKNAICTCNYQAVTGFDAKKFSDLLVRALMRPSVNSGKDKIILIGVIAIAIASLAILYLSYKNYDLLLQIPGSLKSVVSAAISSTKGTVSAAGVI